MHACILILSLNLITEGIVMILKVELWLRGQYFSIQVLTYAYTIQMWTNMYQQVTEDPTHTCTDTIRLVNYRKEPLPFSLCSPAPPSQPDRVPVVAPERQPPTIPALRTPDPRRTIPQAWVHGEWIENAKHKYTRHCSKPSSPRQH